MRCIFVSCVLILIASSASAGGNIVNATEICQYDARGIAAAAPCLAKVLRQTAADNDAKGYTSAAALQRQLAIRIEVIGDRVRAGEISAEQGATQYKAAMNKTRSEVDVAAQNDEQAMEEQRRLAVRRFLATRPQVDWGQQLMNTFTLQGAMHPNCSRWGVC